MLRLITVDAAHYHTLNILVRHLALLSQRLDELAGRVPFHRAGLHMQKMQVDLSLVVAKALETVKAAIDVREQKLAVVVPIQAVPLLCDPVRLSQVLETLLDNASRYTPIGGAISLVAAVDGGELTIEVVDSGKGMGPELLACLFNVFQPDSYPEADTGAPGVALALARDLIELHGGSIAAHSDGPGCGSRFTVRLPLTQPAPGASIDAAPLRDAAGEAAPNPCAAPGTGTGIA